MKNILLNVILLSAISIQSENQTTLTTQQEEDFALLQEAIEIVASMSDNIANLAIQHKTDSSSPQLTKQECIALVEKMTSLVITILKKQKLKKASRKIVCNSSLDFLDFDELLDHVAQEVFEKINTEF